MIAKFYQILLDIFIKKIVNFFAMKYLVTGGTGFIGSNIVEMLLKEGKEVVCLIRKEGDLRWLRDYIKYVEIRYGDFLYPETLKESFKDIDVILHTAGVLNTYNWHNYYLINFLGTKNIVKACSESSKIKRFIFFSNLNAAGPSLSKNFRDEEDIPKPVSHFGRSKLLGEEEVFKAKEYFNVLILRTTLLYGQRDLNLLNLFKAVKMGFFVVFGDDDKIINLCHIDDLTAAVSLTLRKDLPSGEIINIGGENYPIYEIKDSFSKVLKKSLRTIRLGKGILIPLSYMAELTGRLFHKPLVLNIDRVKDLSQNNWGVCIDKARKMLGYNPSVSLVDGLQRTYEWYVQKGYL